MIEHHFEEAEFLVERWRDALDEPDTTLQELAADVELRLHAHLEGLLVAGPRALLEFAWPALLDRPPDLSRAMCAGLMILQQGTLSDCARLLSLLDEYTRSDEVWTGVVAALGLSRREGLGQWLQTQLGQQPPGPGLTGILSALAQRGVALGSRLTPLLSSSDPAVLIAAAQLARRAEPTQLRLLASLATHEDPKVIAAVVETCILREVSGALDVARYWAFDAPECEFRRSALLWVSLFGNSVDQGRVIALFDDQVLRPHALWGASFSGRAAAVDAAIPWLTEAQSAPLAAELITAIAGLPTSDDTLWRDREPSERDGQLPTLAEDLETEPGLEPEDFLPLPNPEAIAAWWRAHRPQVEQGPLLLGRPLERSALVQELLEAPMRRRHALALLAYRRYPALRARGPLATRSWARAQLQQLEALRAGLSSA